MTDTQNQNQSDSVLNDAQTTVAGVAVTLENIATGKDDPTVGKVSLLSQPKEVHAVMVGMLAVFMPDVLMAAGFPEGVAAALGPGFAASYVFGRTTKDLAKMAETVVETQHVRDALAEPAYTSAGYLIALGLVELSTVVS